MFKPFLLSKVVSLSILGFSSLTLANVSSNDSVGKYSGDIENHYIVHIRSGYKVQDVVQDARAVPENVYENVFNGFAAELTNQELEDLRKDPRIELIEPDTVVSVDPLDVENSGPISAAVVENTPLWYLDRIDQRNLPLNNTYTYTRNGAGVTAYVVDSGIRFDHVQFEGRAVRGFDASGGTGADCNGHGTHVAGIIGGVNTGVAKKVKLVSVKVVGCTGSGTSSQLLAGLEWIQKNRKGPAVVNMSLGSSANAAIDKAVNTLIARGMTVVTAAGNSNADACLSSPARVAGAVTIGASAQNDSRASFSNWGKCVDFFAPGASIISAYYSAPDLYAEMSGTSQAAPQVAGAAALHLQRFPFATPAFIRNKMFELSTKAKVTTARSVNNHLLFTYRPTETVPPTTSITAPRTGATVPTGVNVTITASAQDNLKVEVVMFLVNGQIRCRDYAAPFTCAWTPPTRGATYTLTSRAMDSAGNMRNSAVVSVKAQ